MEELITSLVSGRACLTLRNHLDQQVGFGAVQGKRLVGHFMDGLGQPDEVFHGITLGGSDVDVDDVRPAGKLLFQEILNHLLVPLGDCRADVAIHAVDSLTKDNHLVGSLLKCVIVGGAGAPPANHVD